MRVAALLAGLPLLVLPLVARAASPSPLRADLVEGRAVKLDGVPKEWAAGLDELGEVVKGKPERGDLSAKAVLAYDDTYLYVAADVVDDRLVGGSDRVVVVLGFPGGATQELSLYPGEPGKSAGEAKHMGSVVAGAKVIEAPESDGYTLEARIPWAAIPGASEVRVGLRAGLFVHDGDGGAVDGIVGSASVSAFSALAPLWTEPEQALWDGLVKQKGLPRTPTHDVLADVDGDGSKERLLTFGTYLVALGPRFREGKQYFYGDLGADAANVLRFEPKELTGDGKVELVVVRRFGVEDRYREMLEVLGFGSDGVPRSLFRHETAVVTEVGAIRNDVRFSPAKAGQAIVVGTQAAKGFDRASYHEATETTFPAILLPWGAIRSRRYEVRGGTFVEASTETQPVASASAAPSAAPPPSAPPASAKAASTPAELAAKLLAQWKRDRRLAGTPRVDLSADVTGSAAPERVVLLGRELGVLGAKGSGTSGYATLTLTAFAASEDITSVTTRDVTGDGKAEILVRGVQRAPAPKPLDGGTLDREVLFVFDTSQGTPKRIFAAEVGLSHGPKRLSATARFLDAKTGRELEVAADKPTGWTQATYPFAADTGPVGGVEPLPLPWSDDKTVRYRWSGSAFTRQ